MPKTLTALAIGAAFREAKKSNKSLWLSDGSIPRGHGGLQLRVQPDGQARWYWRYSNGSRKVRLALGLYAAEKTAGCMTLPEARQAVTQKAALYQAPESRDVREHLKREQQMLAAKREAEALEAAKAAAALELSKKHTLLALMRTYADELAVAGKQSEADVRYMIRSHIEIAHPALAETPAKTIMPDDINRILRPLVAAGKGRTAAKLRSYMRAAYARATSARLDSSASQALVDFNLQTNPVAVTGGLSQFNKALDRALKVAELREYWCRLGKQPAGAMRDALMLALLLGGQRPAQLVRVTTADVDVSARTVSLFDPKGKRAQPRLHILPICDQAMTVLESCISRAARQKSPYLLSSYGKVPVRPEQLSKIVTDISAGMLVDGVVDAKFQLRDLRRTVETLMAAEGVTQDVLARLLSHGLGGVQARHYNRHSYLPEMRAALTRWEQLVTGNAPTAEVLIFKSGAA